MCDVCVYEDVKCDLCGKVMYAHSVEMMNDGLATQFLCKGGCSETYMYHQFECNCETCSEFEEVMTHNDDPPPPF